MYGIDLPQFHYYGVQKIGTEFYQDMLMTIGKEWDEEDNYEFHNTLHSEEGGLKVWVIESGISQIKTLSPSKINQQ